MKRIDVFFQMYQRTRHWIPALIRDRYIVHELGPTPMYHKKAMKY